MVPLSPVIPDGYGYNGYVLTSDRSSLLEQNERILAKNIAKEGASSFARISFYVKSSLFTYTVLASRAHMHFGAGSGASYAMTGDDRWPKNWFRMNSSVLGTSSTFPTFVPRNVVL